MGRASRIHRHAGGFRFRHRGRELWRKNYADAVRLFADTVGRSITDSAKTVGGCLPAWQLEHPTDFHERISRPLIAWAGTQLLDRVGDDFLANYRNHLIADGYAPETVRKMVFAAASVLRLANKRGWLAAVPTVPKCPAPQPAPKGIDPAQFAKLIAKLRRQARTKHVVPLIEFAADTGMRPGEVCGLRWEYVDLSRGSIVLVEHKTAKRTGAARFIVLPQSAIDILKRCERVGPYVFVNRSGRPYTRGGLLATIRRYGITPNQLRHTFAQTMIDAGVRPELVTEMLGHRTSRMVWQYAAIHAERVRAALAQVATPSQIAARGQSVPAIPESAEPRLRKAAQGRRRG